MRYSAAIVEWCEPHLKKIGIDLGLEGCTRFVILTKNHALKIPQIMYDWRMPLYGMLGNDREGRMSRLHDDLCPVKLSLPFGLLNVQPRCRMLTYEEFEENLEEITRISKSFSISERKHNSYGYLNGKIVVVDYGS